LAHTAGHNGASTTSWVLRPRPVEQARLRIFGFPYAGVGPSVFRPWLTELPPGVEMRLVQLPGREARWREPALMSIGEIAPAVTEALLPQLAEPFVFYGHSLGGLIAFEVTRLLRRRGGPMPRHMFIGAHRAPHLPNPHPPIRHLADAEFIDQIRRRYDGIPQAVLDNPELLELMLPCLRADFHAYETYDYVEDSPLPCPMSVFGGEKDTYVTATEVAGWREQTSAAFRLRMTNGNHFFLQTHRPAILAGIREDLAGAIADPPVAAWQ
jgi:surfactin synthase thioesterase subunit